MLGYSHGCTLTWLKRWESLCNTLIILFYHIPYTEFLSKKALHRDQCLPCFVFYFPKAYSSRAECARVSCLSACLPVFMSACLSGPALVASPLSSLSRDWIWDMHQQTPHAFGHPTRPPTRLLLQRNVHVILIWPKWEHRPNLLSRRLPQTPTASLLLCNLHHVILPRHSAVPPASHHGSPDTRRSGSQQRNKEKRNR